MLTVEPTIIFAQKQSVVIGESIAAQNLADTLILALKCHQLTITIDKGEAILLGRNHTSNITQPQVDLTPYGAVASGTSRLHASICNDTQGWTLTDLNSSNGTWIDGQRIAPFVPHRLEMFSLVLLAKLELRVILSGKTLPA